MNIFVGALSFEVTEEELKEKFEEFGRVISAKIIKDRDTGRSKGFAFVEMDNTQEAKTAISSLNGTEINGRKIAVNEAKPREERSGGNFGRGGNSNNRGGNFRGGNSGGGRRY